jgi:coproporphyrinogen III oxidase-like Fe-S oxidoreductase
VQRCRYCNFAIHALGKDEATSSPLHTLYIQNLCKEIDLTCQMYAHRIDASVPLNSLYFGGGTPSLAPKQEFS